LFLSQQVVVFLDSEARAVADRLKLDFGFQIKGLRINGE
jgi:hypothetical protein